MSPLPGTREHLLAARSHRTLRRVSFDRLDLSMVVRPKCRLDRCTFVGGDLRHATLDGSFFKFCNFSRADLRGASLRFATFAACALQEADLRDCDLTGATFGRRQHRYRQQHLHRRDWRGLVARRCSKRGLRARRRRARLKMPTAAPERAPQGRRPTRVHQEVSCTPMRHSWTEASWPLIGNGGTLERLPRS